jgi:hypothetical protein
MDPNTMTNVAFRKDIIGNGFTTALVYKLQKKKHPESNMDNTKENHYLFITWNVCNSYDFSVNALLITHSNTVTWNEDKLNKLHTTYYALRKHGPIIEHTWRLDDTTAFTTTLKWQLDLTTEITISERTSKDNSIASIN